MRLGYPVLAGISIVTFLLGHSTYEGLTHPEIYDGLGRLNFFIAAYIVDLCAGLGVWMGLETFRAPSFETGVERWKKYEKEVRNLPKLQQKGDLRNPM